MRHIPPFFHSLVISSNRILPIFSGIKLSLIYFVGLSNQLDLISDSPEKVSISL